MKSIVINKNDANQRLDKFVGKVCKGMPNSLVYKYIRKKRVKVGGRGKDASYILLEGDVVDLYINDEFFKRESSVPALTKHTSIDAVYEDENIIIVNKPVGLLCHSDKGRDSLIDYIHTYLYNKGEYAPDKEKSFAPALCHRLDRNTSGLVIAAKNAPGLRVINEKIKKREISKYYLCRVCGIPKVKSGSLAGFSVKDKDKNIVYIFDEPRDSSKEVILKYQILSTTGNSSLAEVELVTGRSHQIRAQFANIGHPLVGDKKYGGVGAQSQKLCAYKIIFNFTTDAGVLNYLRNKEISIAPPF